MDCIDFRLDIPCIRVKIRVGLPLNSGESEKRELLWPENIMRN
jgi:hypothetical protein